MSDYIKCATEGCARPAVSNLCEQCEAKAEARLMLVNLSSFTETGGERMQIFKSEYLKLSKFWGEDVYPTFKTLEDWELEYKEWCEHEENC